MKKKVDEILEVVKTAIIRTAFRSVCPEDSSRELLLPGRLSFIQTYF
jgi:hypothetical protein